MSYLRGGIRRSLWNRSPIKLEFIKQNRKRIPNPNPKGRVAEVWGGTCALTGKDFPLAELEVDHVIGNHSLREIGDLQSFIENIVCISFNDLQFVSKEAHRTKSLAEKLGVSFEEAEIEQQVISLCKLKAADQDAWLATYGVTTAKKADARRKAIREVLSGLENTSRKAS